MSKEAEGYYVFHCRACQTNIFPCLRVKIGEVSAFKDEDTLFINPIVLRQYVEDRVDLDSSYRNAQQIKPEALRDSNKNIYWNLVWYFAEFHLPYDFIVPYADNSRYMDFMNANNHLKLNVQLRVD
jgi:hypothetical protein